MAESEVVGLLKQLMQIPSCSRRTGHWHIPRVTLEEFGLHTLAAMYKHILALLARRVFASLRTWIRFLDISHFERHPIYKGGPEV
ncbi:hypothetical protein N7481_002349 [Penicillium waksmanii]|uniref:uncharacterized protein n=1 Tax=Penicillium waksmanii TaxID=69791 RepID=UPI002547D06B|nr:uncharacterized protein N7481_002349 [Penicillium waksmanii]KAJ5995372.1 hypothetical protein N7481_002349 [Penicillium waksmanii]